VISRVSFRYCVILIKHGVCLSRKFAIGMFPKSIIVSYFHVTYNNKGSIDDTQMFQVLISETIMRAISSNIITDEDINSFDPRVIISIPRLTIISALHWMPECVLVTDAEKGFRLFREKAERMKSLKLDLDKMSVEEICVLEEMLVDCDAWDKSLKRPLKRDVSEASDDDLPLALVYNISGDKTITNEEEEPGNSTLIGLEESEKYYNQRDTMHRVYREVCGVADDMQSGPRAREFVSLLHKAFKMHTEQE
jgi:hypothetical protein